MPKKSPVRSEHPQMMSTSHKPSTVTRTQSGTGGRPRRDITGQSSHGREERGERKMGFPREVLSPPPLTPLLSLSAAPLPLSFAHSSSTCLVSTRLSVWSQGTFVSWGDSLYLGVPIRYCRGRPSRTRLSSHGAAPPLVPVAGPLRWPPWESRSWPFEATQWPPCHAPDSSEAQGARRLCVALSLITLLPGAAEAGHDATRDERLRQGDVSVGMGHSNRC